MEIQGSVVVVTGASSGIGLSTARSFARAGAKVALAARSSETINAVAEELRELGYEALAIPTDVRDQTQVQHLIDATCIYYGHLDILINNAALDSAAFVADERVDHFRLLFDVNVFGPLYAMQAAIKRMRQHGGGLIMNVSSGASRAAIPGLVAYGASKAALDLVSNTARKELAAENIRIITIYPPNTATNAAKHMLDDPELLRRSLEEALTSTGMVVVPAEYVAEKIVGAARNEPEDLFLDEGLLKEMVS
jgi:NADP-dependent 3-hydroxy acid dehydrogenase YdfG